MGFHKVPVEILELILLRLDSPICLVRASSTCKQWRQIIAGAAFLQRFRSLHEPQVVGSYHNTRILPARPRFEPSPPPTSASCPLSPTIKSRYLSLDFLPVNDSTLCSWKIRNSRGHLLLLDYGTYRGLRDTGLFICEPLTRLYQKIPPLTASPPEYHQFDAFLLDSAEPGDISMSNFMIFCLYLPDGIAGIFTSGGSWRKVSIDHVPSMEYFGFAAGSLYYYSYRRTVYTLDQGATEFSSSLLPDADAEDFDQPLFVSKLAATAGHDGKARIFFLDAGDNLKILARKIDSRGGSDWMPEKNIQLSAAMLGVPSYQQCYFIWSPPFCIRQTVDTVRIFVSTGQKDGWSVFRLDIETQQLERTTYPAGYAIKLPWPPSLQACLH
ncbi:hypothetical protein EJB05_42625, partial [Eragrostis curvula]